MPNKCDYCPTPIDWKKDTWIERHAPGKPVESAHEDCYSKGRFLVKSRGKVPAFSEHVSTPRIEHAGAGTPPHGLRLCHTGANGQAQGRSTTTSMARALVAGRLKRGP